MDDGRGYRTGSIATQANGYPYGMGLMLINNLMDDIKFNDKGNCITIVKNLNEEKQTPSRYFIF